MTSVMGEELLAERNRLHKDRRATRVAEWCSGITLALVAVVAGVLSIALGSFVALAVALLSVVALPINQAILQRAHRLLNEAEASLHMDLD